MKPATINKNCILCSISRHFTTTVIELINCFVRIAQSALNIRVYTIFVLQVVIESLVEYLLEWSRVGRLASIKHHTSYFLICVVSINLVTIYIEPEQIIDVFSSKDVANHISCFILFGSHISKIGCHVDVENSILVDLNIELIDKYLF